MANVSIYLNFNGTTEKAFNFYKKVFKTEFSAPIFKMKDLPNPEFVSKLSEEDKNKVMQVALPIIGGTLLMGTDILESMGHRLIEGNNITINLNLDSKEQADELYQELSQGGSDCVAPHDEFWGYWGVCKDQFGIRWMFNVAKSV
ncbi:MAG: VOC family protein [Bacteroidia bacterium]